jgi:hypothetical protein
MKYQLIEISGKVVAEREDRPFTFGELLQHETEQKTFLLRKEMAVND